MRPAPAQLVEGLSDSDVYVAQKWWCQLTEDVQGDLTILFDPNQDSCRVRSNEITIIVNSELLCDDDENTDDWADFYEYMLDHPEVFPPYVPIDRTFVIGCLHSKNGVHWVVQAASAGFLCPFNSPVCPFRR
jgi:hypothetical protein